jgi:dolichyl-phosphate-mannose-protein mannosyltransferase
LTRERLLLLGIAGVSVAARAFDITQPFVDDWSWRQSDVAMIAENFYHHGLNLFYPRINWAGAAPGYVGTEFPLVPLIAALLYMMIGVQDWIGRAVSIAFFSASLPFLFLLVERVYGRRAALLATAVYCAVPVSIFSARSFMPDTASLTFAIVAVWLFVRWLDEERRWLLAAAGLAAALALLVKLAAVSIAIPMLALAMRKYGRRLLERVDLWTAAVTVVLLTCAWYLHGYRISLVYPPYHFFGSGWFGLASANIYGSVFQYIAMSGLTPFVVVLALGGLVLGRERAGGEVFHWWLLGAVIFVVPLARGYHSWYALAFVPPASGLAGAALEHVQRRLTEACGRRLGFGVIGLLFMVLIVLSWRTVSPLYTSVNETAYRAGMALDRLSPHDALVAVVDEGEPATLYYSRRRGWHFRAYGGSQEAIAELTVLKREGAHSLTLLRHTRWWLTHYPEFARYLAAHARIIEDTSDYVIFALTDDRSSSNATDRPCAGAQERRQGGGVKGLRTTVPSTGPLWGLCSPT